MGHLNWTSESFSWLSDIFEYISAENPIAAEAWFQAFSNEPRCCWHIPKLVIVTDLQSDKFEF
jgi:hypothetical protein